MRLLAGLAIVAWAAAGCERTMAADADLKARVDPLARPLIEQGVAVGFVVGILKDGETRVLPYGETVKGSGKAPDADTVYEIGSITKVFTGVLLADAAERGLVALDDPVRKHLPDAVTLPVKDKPMTLADLAQHTSGLPRLPENMSPADAANPYADYTVGQLHASLANHRLRRAPGEYEYSNYGFGLLGHVLALRTGRSYEQLVVDRIAGPLGMPDTRIELDDDQRRRLAAPYSADLEPAANWDLPALAGAGALRSTCRDMLTFAKANIDSPQGTLGRAIERAQAERVKIGGGRRGTGQATPRLAIGLGWHLAADHQTRWHDGGTGGYYAWLAVVPGLRLGVVVLANTSTERISQFGELVTRAAAGMDVQPPAVQTEVPVDPETLARYVGAYALAPEFVLDVTLEAGRLMVQATGQQKFPVFASGPGKFFYKVVDAQLTFVDGKDGRVDRVILHQGGRDVEGIRKH